MPVVPQPDGTLEGHQATLMSLKEAVEILLRQRGTTEDSAVTWNDLLNLKLITADQVEPNARR